MMRSFLVAFSVIFLFASTSAAQEETLREESTKKTTKKKNQARTIVLFGSNGAVGSEVLSTLLHQNKNKEDSISTFWDQVILIGRRFPTIPKEVKHPQVVKIPVSSLENIDQQTKVLNEHFHDVSVDACIIAVGMGSPHEANVAFWHSVEVDMIGSIARFCGKMGATYTSLLSSADADENPVPFTREELTKSDKPLGWLKMIMVYMRMKGLSELAAINNFRQAATHSSAHVSIMQPSNIVTETTRYGWVDYLLFKALPWLDPLLSESHHSVHVKLLGMAFAKDAENVLTLKDGGSNSHSIEEKGVSVTKLTYKDFLKASRDEFVNIQNDLSGTRWEL